MKNLFLLLSSLCLTSAWSQITITSADFPVPNDTVIISSSNETAIDISSTGADLTWDFSTISVDDQQLDTFWAASDADFLYQIAFNNALSSPDHVSDYYRPWSGGALGQLGQFGIGIESPVLFTKVSADSVYNTGFGMEVGGFSVPAKSDTMDVQYMLPMSYGDSWVSNSYTNLDLNPTYDAIYRRYQERNSIVDSWGSISTPYGTFDAIRVKSLISGTDSLYIDLGFGADWYTLPAPDQIEYEWFANGQKIPVFKVVTSDILGTETINSVEFKDYNRDGVGMEEVIFDQNIYPNPASTGFFIELQETAKQVSVLDITGKIVHEIQPSSNKISVSTIGWDKGIYFIRILNSKGTSTSQLVVQ